MKNLYEEQLGERIRLNEIQDVKRDCIAARDKEWVASIEHQRDEVCCVGQTTTLCPLADPCCSFMRNSCNWWQERKGGIGL